MIYLNTTISSLYLVNSDIKKMVFVGKMTYLEVWPAEKWDERYGVLDPGKIDKMIQDLKKYGV